MNRLASRFAMLAAAASVAAVRADVKISQVWGGGGVTAGTPNADYVELFNTDAANPTDLTGWSLQIASPTGAAWSKIDLSGSVAPRHYFLIRIAAAGTLGTTFTADVNGNLNGATLISTGGKVALVNNTTLLTAACPVPGPSIVDCVGFGSPPACREGPDSGSNAPGGSATGAGVTPFRKCDGLTDTNDNHADFELHPPAPRNTSSPPNPGTGVVLT